MKRLVFCLIIALFTPVAVSVSVDNEREQKTSSYVSGISRVWDDKEMASLELPLAQAAASPKPISADYYYQIPVRPIYKSYPVYALGKEPAGYLDSLKQQEPEQAFDPSILKAGADWIKTGEIVFEAPIFYDAVVKASHIQDSTWYEQIGVQVAKDGTLPYFRYVIRQKGKIELGTVSCAMCHTRVMPDGRTIKEVHANVPFDLAAAFNASQNLTLERLRGIQRSLFGAPWIRPDPQEGLEQRSLAEVAEWHSAIPPGVMARQGTSPLYPTQVPDLIGLRERKYLDHTGLVRH